MLNLVFTFLEADTKKNEPIDQAAKKKDKKVDKKVLTFHMTTLTNFQTEALMNQWSQRQKEMQETAQTVTSKPKRYTKPHLEHRFPCLPFIN